MKKSLLCFAIASLAMMFSTSMNAQVQTATLQHNDTLRVFGGEGSFQSAYNAAVDGDTIFLSPGTFRSVSYLEKSITVQGSGYRTNMDLSLRQTYLNGSMYIGKSSNNTLDKLTLEGLYMDNNLNDRGPVNNLNIRHCSISSLDLNKYSSTYTNVLIEHCIISNTFRTPSTYYDFIVSCCYIGSITASSKNISSTMVIANCYLNSLTNNGSSSAPNNYVVCQFNNSIIAGTVKPNSSCTAYNCVTPPGLLSNILDKEGNYEVSDIPSLFVQGYTSYANYYKLTDEAAATYLGQDGTQVGIYGSPRPFTFIPSYPRIVEKNIAGQTTTDGKLRVYVKAQSQK